MSSLYILEIKPLGYNGGEGGRVFRNIYKGHKGKTKGGVESGVGGGDGLGGGCGGEKMETTVLEQQFFLNLKIYY